MAVTIERVLAVRFPLRAKFFCNRSRLTVSIVTIFLLSFALNSYHYVSRKTIIIPFKNNSVGNTNCTFAITPVDPILEPAKHEYVTVSICLTFATSIVLPMVLLIVLNSVLIHFLRKNRQEMIGKGAGDNHKFGPLARLTQEMKITLTVTILIVAFVVFNLPGGIVHAVELFKYQLAAAKAPLLFYEITELCNVLAITQKSLNFFLYCFSSATFRSRLYKVLIRQVPRQLLLDRSKRRANSRTSVTFITNSLGRRCSAHSGGSLSNVAENSTKSKLAALRLPLTKRRDSASDSIEPEHIRLYGGVDSQQVEHVYKNGYEEVDSV